MTSFLLLLNRTGEHTNRVYTEVTGMVGILPMPFPDVERDSCLAKNLRCPVHPHDRVTYHHELGIESWFPEVSTDI